MKLLHLVRICVLFLGSLALAQTPIPLINQPLVPASVPPGSGAFTLTVNGTGFTSNAVVYWNGSLRSTTVVSASRVQAQITAADVAKASVAWVTVGNLGAGEVQSNVVNFPVRTSAKGLGFLPRSVQNITNPGPVVVGDFNNDGLLDFAVGSEMTIQVFLGKGNGTFQPPIVTTLDIGVNELTAGDFNGDGRLDLVALGTLGNSNRRIIVLLGKGNGKFSAKRGFYGPTGSFILGAADFNGDGRLDLYIGGDYPKYGPFFQVNLGNGDGTFSGGSGQYFNCDEGPPTMGDFNGDGLIDIAATDCGVVDIFLNSTNGFQGGPLVYQTTFGGTLIATADLNGDGILDLVTDGVSVLLGKGDGTFQNAGGITSGANGSINIGDFNGDGKLDVLAGSSVLLGDGSGHFQEPLTFAGLASGLPMSVGGFNADGGLDLLGINALNDALTISVQVPAYLTPISLNFGQVTIGTTSPPQPATLTNFGPKALAISSIGITGVNAADFAQTNNCGKSLPPDGSCQIQTTFSPSLLGTESAAISVTYKGSGPLSLPLSGTGTHQSNTVTLTPPSLIFAMQLVTTTSPSQAATLTNTGNQPITISNIATSAPFGQTNNCPSTLPVEGSCQINVVFTPTDKGTANGTLSVIDDAVGSPQQVQLSGTGTAVKLSPTAINFGNQKVGTKSVPVPLTLTNLGTGALSITEIAIKGADPKDFTQTNDCGGSVPPQSQCTITVTFTPTAKGSRSANVSVSDNDPTSPQSVPLTGNGT
jgi:FG-GAP-like repeat/Abnormal spindle-like microcephaly-assoc'd, ASPM-SPD-2-Hydin